MTRQEQARLALMAANAQRSRIATVKRDLSAGRITLREVLLDPPAELAKLPIVDVVRAARGARRPAQGQKWLERMGRVAVRDGVNLFVPLGCASTRTRLWVLEHATWSARDWLACRDEPVAAITKRAA